MRFVFGDSHARILVPTQDDALHVVERPDGEWRTMATGGATAHNLGNEQSKTGCGRRIFDTLDSFGDMKEVVLMFGEVDCANHITKSNDRTAAITDTQSRYMRFVSELTQRADISRVTICGVVPRTRAFVMDGFTASEITEIIREWNSLLGPHVDVFTPLIGQDGFIADVLSHNNKDPGERHLSVAGGQLVWQQIELSLPHLPPYPLDLLSP